MIKNYLKKKKKKLNWRRGPLRCYPGRSEDPLSTTKWSIVM